MFFQYLSLLFQSWHSVCGVRWQLQKERNRTMHEQLYREIEGMQDRLAAWRRVLHQIPEVSMDLPKYPGLCERPAERDGRGLHPGGRCGLYALLGQGDGTHPAPCRMRNCGIYISVRRIAHTTLCRSCHSDIPGNPTPCYLRWYFLQHVDMVCTYLCFHYPNTFPFA